jgi:phosphoglycerate dehydrogenase-like enzyme
VSDARVVVTFSPPAPDVRAAIDETLSSLATVTYLPEVAGDERHAVLQAADAVLAWFIGGELRPDELELLGTAKLLQLYSAGVDRVPVDDLPPQLPIAANAGAYADPMAEHVLAMALALAKRLPQNEAKMARGEFDQQTPTLAIRGATAGILGFGGIGQASARLFRALGARIHALNRSGRTDEPVDWIGSMDDLDALLEVADIVVVSLPLTRGTRGLIGARELGLMKRDAILVNVARAAIVDEDALYEHLRANPSFSAGIDAWWQEPREGGAFATRHPFLELPNVIGSPHNSALTAGTLATAAHHAAENIARGLRSEPVDHLIDRSEYAG